MSLLEQARADWKAITSNANEFGVSIVFLTPDGVSPSVSATVTGLHTKHHLSVSTEGQRVNSKNAHISISEELLTAANPDYPVRDEDTGEVSLVNHIVTVKDSTGEDKNYVIREHYPDETVGMIVCILGDYE